LDISLGEYVELDRLNMTAILDAADETFNATNREARLTKSLATNGRLIEVRRDGRLAAYAELRFTGDRCALWSVQVHPCYQQGTALLGLLCRIAEELDSSQVRVVTSAANAGNEKSIRLHRLLGFREVGESGGKVLFEACAGELTGRVYVARTTRAESGDEYAGVGGRGPRCDREQ
jgi:L-amino acid N-acyltransferase YncA